MTDKIIAVIVTYNRKELLIRCLNSLLSQKFLPDRILIIDNASTDGTWSLLSSQGYLQKNVIEYIKLDENIGGSGGFNEGVKRATSIDGNCWIWLLDDDAVTDPAALEILVDKATDKQTIYASVAVEDKPSSQLLCWPASIRLNNKKPQTIVQYDQLPEIASVKNVPFLGFFIHSSLVKIIGLPDKSFFINGDDAEYCARARKTGTSIFLVKSSIIRHPLPERIMLHVFGQKIYILKSSPWKRYYEVRNRILIAKKYYGRQLWFKTIPGTVLRWIVSLLLQNERLQQTQAFMLGTWHGLTGRSGMRTHDKKNGFLS